MMKRKHIFIVIAAFVIVFAFPTVAFAIDYTVDGTTSDFNIPSGTHTVTGTGTCLITCSSGVDLTINNLTLSDTSGNALSFSGSGNTLRIEGSNRLSTGSASNGAVINVPETATLTITGSGSLEATANGRGAAIGGEYFLNGGIIIINGGEIIARSTQSFAGAGIGGGLNGSFISITINGGDITARSSQGAAAIGQGYQTTNSDPVGAIYIRGGTINASAGVADGAGIGGAYTSLASSSQAPSVSITGGVVYTDAAGYYNDIGGGTNQTTNTVSIGGTAEVFLGSDRINGGANGATTSTHTYVTGVTAVNAAPTTYHFSAPDLASWNPSGGTRAGYFISFAVSNPQTGEDSWFNRVMNWFKSI